MSDNSAGRPGGTQTSVIIALIVLVGLVLGGVFGLVLAGRPVDDFLTSVTLIAVPTGVALVAAVKSGKTNEQVYRNSETLQTIASTTNGKNDRLLSDKLALEAQLSALGHTPITHADAVSAQQRGRHSDG